MIRIQSSGGEEKSLAHVFVCDICGQVIARVEEGAVIHAGRGLGQGELLELMHVHKESCLLHGEAMIGRDRAIWHELADHVIEIAGGLGFNDPKNDQQRDRLDPIGP